MYVLNGCRPQAQTLNLEIPIIVGVLVGEISTRIVTHMLEDSHVGGTRVLNTPGRLLHFERMLSTTPN